MRDPPLLPGPGRGGGHQVRFPKLKGGCYTVHRQVSYVTLKDLPFVAVLSDLIFQVIPSPAPVSEPKTRPSIQYTCIYFLKNIKVIARLLKTLGKRVCIQR
jgi:hypothetical protein